MQRYYTRPGFQAAKTLRSAGASPRSTLLTRKHIITSAGRAEVFDDGRRWLLNEKPRDAQPNPLLALCRNAEEAESQERERAQNVRRAA